jgi:MerR family redox-sensitive transcriptional activator SoxR
MADWTIGEVAGRAGLRPSAIRYYETAGLLPTPLRRAGRRIYDEAVLRRLALIALAQRAGFTVREVRTLLHGFAPRTAPPARWRTLTERKLAELEARVREARAMQAVIRRLRACACPTLEDCGRALTAARTPTGSAPPASARSRGRARRSGSS